jgi:hypothetical protein
VRTHCKRLARLTLAFSKKLENFKAAIALHIAYYNFLKMHGSLRACDGSRRRRPRLEFGRNRVPARLIASYATAFALEGASSEDQMRDLFAEDSNN